MSSAESFVNKKAIIMANKYNSKKLNKLEWLMELISDDCKVPDDERLILLGRILNVHNLDDFCKSVILCKNNIKGICADLVSLKTIKLKDLFTYERDYGRDNLKHDLENDFVFSVYNLHGETALELEKLFTNVSQNKRDNFSKNLLKNSPDLKDESVPEIKVNKTHEYMSYKTKETAYKYLYNVFAKNYRANILLPLIIFQSIFHRTDDLLRAVDYSFKFLKINPIKLKLPELPKNLTNEKEKELKYKIAAIMHIRMVLKHIEDEKTYIYQGESKSYGFQKENGLRLSDCFIYTAFNKNKSGLDEKGWYDYFIAMCALMIRTNFITDDESFQKNCIAFLCMSNIFDLIFCNEYHYDIDDNHYGISGIKFPHFLHQRFFTCLKNENEETSCYKFPAFNWDIFSIYKSNSDIDKLFEFRQPEYPDKSIYKFQPLKTILKSNNIDSFIEKNYDLKDAYIFYDHKNSYIREIKNNTTFKVKDFIVSEAFERYFSKLIKKQIFEFLLDFMEIKAAREKLGKELPNS